ncbi:LysR family transcriptional regulator [Pigmentiphaga sp.]|uniref:LysR family transcriptional regulator n=1 Tax=Pigmentiphaga sp. TaxID=1977564 RepID=UPI00128C8E72|nr:LysR family transcriptional regulator [Pigmentiphaga sp.]MPS27759.1 LysR family transcriptional regulator [Alcaligenaceae bacterium SAGV5]MPS50869.1 LysR family transcriptional regulator [Alcaligenaceae bacterium SAGV3]MPT59581.1 LysR family transcriptional regulator [Alcaligenaceae bacterium]
MRPTARPLTRQIDLNLLELFDTIYQTRNLTACGQRLGLSQPAVSYGLAKLRETYGDPLFVRMQRGVVPTPFAEQLSIPVASALQTVRTTIERTEFNPRDANRSFRIAMSDAGERYFLPKLLAYLGDHAPGITVESLSADLRELGEGLASGDIDMAMGFIPGLGKQVHQQTLFPEHFVYVRRKSRATQGMPLTLSQLRNSRHILAAPPATHHLAAVEGVLLSRAVRAEIALRVRSFLSVLPIVADTNLIAPVPSNFGRLAVRESNLEICESPVKFPVFDLNMYWHHRYHADPALTWLRESLVELFGSKEGKRGRKGAV